MEEERGGTREEYEKRDGSSGYIHVSSLSKEASHRTRHRACAIFLPSPSHSFTVGTKLFSHTIRKVNIILNE